MVVLTGAGISTDSGVPDYRGPNSVRATPMMYGEFASDPLARKRYWARNYQGWAHLRGAQPNAGHRAIASWERGGRPTALAGVITQNVDGLHEAAGTQRLTATVLAANPSMRALGQALGFTESPDPTDPAVVHLSLALQPSAPPGTPARRGAVRRSGVKKA